LANSKWSILHQDVQSEGIEQKFLTISMWAEKSHLWIL